MSAPAQVEAMVVLCGRLEKAHGLDDGSLRFEVQIETPPAILGADGTATVARLITAAQGRCVRSALRHVRLQRVGGHRGRVPEPGASGRRPREGGAAGRRRRHRGAALRRLHQRVAGRRYRLGARRLGPARPAGSPVPRARLLPGLGPAPGPAADPVRCHVHVLPRGGADGRRSGSGATCPGAAPGILDEPATARAMAGFLLRGLDCGALDPDEVEFDRSTLEGL